MEKNSFFKTKEGGLTLAFIVIMIAFAIMLFGLYTGTTAACAVGFVIMMAAMFFTGESVYLNTKT